MYTTEKNNIKFERCKRKKILPTNEISDDICVAYKNGIRIVILTRIRAVKMFSKCRFYSGAILEELDYR